MRGDTSWAGRGGQQAWAQPGTPDAVVDELADRLASQRADWLAHLVARDDGTYALA
ncbi:hypothetical protein ACKFRT_08085 [Corynebacterium sp. YSMAA1_1_F7]|uniref:hypothetical protein n=1 Tax=Corynebacterium sp. YSMAA1_1_F7 TaxID=3383590 RepID=UPI0038D05671